MLGSTEHSFGINGQNVEWLHALWNQMDNFSKHSVPSSDPWPGLEIKFSKIIKKLSFAIPSSGDNSWFRRLSQLGSFYPKLQTKETYAGACFHSRRSFHFRIEFKLYFIVNSCHFGVRWGSAFWWKWEGFEILNKLKSHCFHQ